MNSSSTQAEPLRPLEPLGPDSLLWKYFGEWRLYLVVPSVGLLELMLPGLGAGVTQHSKFFEEPWGRVFRSVPQIAGAVYDGPQALETAAKIREFHRDIKGTDEHGKRYHALDPETFFWAHATMVWGVITMVDTFDHRLSDAEKQTLYAEAQRWYRHYGVSDRPMPEDWYAFKAYFDRTCGEKLESTEAAAWLTSQLDTPNELRPPHVPNIVWRLLGQTFMRQYRLIVGGTMPPAAREKLGIPWGTWQRTQFKLRVAVIRRVWPLLPSEARYQPRARAGMARVANGG